MFSSLICYIKLRELFLVVHARISGNMSSNALITKIFFLYSFYIVCIRTDISSNKIYVDIKNGHFWYRKASNGRNFP